MALLGKNNPLCFLDIGRDYPRVKRLLVSSALKKIFNTVLGTSAHYFFYLKRRLGRKSELNMLVIVKLAFDRAM